MKLPRIWSNTDFSALSVDWWRVLKTFRRWCLSMTSTTKLSASSICLSFYTEYPTGWKARYNAVLLCWRGGHSCNWLHDGKWNFRQYSMDWVTFKKRLLYRLNLVGSDGDVQVFMNGGAKAAEALPHSCHHFSQNPGVFGMLRDWTGIGGLRIF